MFFLLLMLLLILFILIAVLTYWFHYERKKYPNEDLFNLTLHLKEDIGKVVKILCDKKKVRHVFSPVLWEHIALIIEPYRNIAFDAEYTLVPSVYRLVPCYGLCFVPKEVYDDDKLQEIANLILLKFRDYLRMMGLVYRNYVMYQKYDMRIYVRIFYEEFEEDTIPYESLYRCFLKEKSPADYGNLHDNDLDKELNLW